MWKQGVSTFLIGKTSKHNFFLWLDKNYIWAINYKYEDPHNAVLCGSTGTTVCAVHSLP